MLCCFQDLVGVYRYVHALMTLIASSVASVFLASMFGVFRRHLVSPTYRAAWAYESILNRKAGSTTCDDSQRNRCSVRDTTTTGEPHQTSERMYRLCDPPFNTHSPVSRTRTERAHPRSRFGPHLVVALPDPKAHPAASIRCAPAATPRAREMSSRSRHPASLRLPSCLRLSKSSGGSLRLP